MKQNQRISTIYDVPEGNNYMKSGQLVNFRNPSRDTINLEDIASNLSRICRFAGNCSHFYSVAQHSILVSRLVPEDVEKEALMHDASEAYTGDIISPIKSMLGASFKSIEFGFESAIAQRFNIKNDKETKKKIKNADLFALEIEYDAFVLGKTEKFCSIMEELRLDIGGKAHAPYAWSTSLAYNLFLGMYATLFNDSTIIQHKVNAEHTTYR